MRMWSSYEGDELADSFEQLNRSLPVDRRLLKYEVRASQAWAKGLEGAGILSSEETDQLWHGLEEVYQIASMDDFQPLPSDEDVHTLVERLLTEQLGEVAGKLHTGRSRNDQVATDFRMWMMDACCQLEASMQAYGRSLLQSAEAGEGAAMPGYTHLQPAQPVTWDHWILSHFWPLMRDRIRFRQVNSSASVLPLGSAALAGTGYAVDRQALAAALNFKRVSRNSMDAVADRDFALEFLFACATAGLHLSRMAEMLIIFNTAEFNFIQLSGAYASGSSLMPQKRNPDALELVRAKSGRLIGELTGLMATIKGLPSAYDKDLQEDKAPVFWAYDTLMLLYQVMAGLVADLSINREVMLRSITPEMLATDLADYFVRQGVPFRRAHSLVRKAVERASASGLSLHQAALAEISGENLEIGDDVRLAFDLPNSLESRRASGGTAKTAREQQLAQARQALDESN